MEKQLIEPDILFEAILEETKKGLHASFTVNGMSMWPFLCHGRDQVVISDCDACSLKTGDIVLFQTPLENYMLHRVTGRKGGLFETTGDGNCFRDGWFLDKCLRAKVITIIRKGKKISCSSIWWRLIFRIWMWLFPVRRPLLRMLRFIGYCKAKIRKGVSGSKAA